ncbi:MAG: AraC family transcriptional regulator [Deltaproteobacteria bacterium]|nr:MAG: AraC family transcriptional regulator [Deltaproteobacteria bacterium]
MDLNLQRVEAAVSFIERNLYDDFSLQDVADASGVTRFTLHRFFRACVGETLKGYIRKRRLTQAADQLRSSSVRILDLAMNAGFQSQEAFTRAFQHFFGVTPGRYRKDPNSRRQPGLFQVSSELLVHRSKEVALEPRMVERKEAFTLKGWGVGADLEDDSPIVGLWEKLLEALVQQAQPPSMLYAALQPEHPGVSLEDEHQLAYLAGVTPAQWPATLEPFLSLVVPPGMYAVFEHHGPLEHIVHTVNYIWASWLPQCNYRKSDRPDLEVMSWEAMTSQESYMELWISLEP